MLDPVRELKARASILHARIARGESVERLRALAEFRSASHDTHIAAAPTIRLRQCLSIVSIEFGFSGWQHASALLNGGEVDDFGTTLYPRGAGGHFNAWYRDHAEAAQHRAQAGGFLLAYKRDYFVAEAPFIESLGLDPFAPEWERMGYDWAHPTDLPARTQLYGRLIAGRAKEAP